MSRKTAFCCCLAALIVLIAAQVLAQLLAGLFAQLGVPTWVCNILAGFLYALLAFGLLKIIMEKIFKLSLPDLGMPKLTLQGKWVAVAVLLPMGVKAIYLFLIPGKLVPSGMNREEILQTLSACDSERHPESLGNKDGSCLSIDAVWPSPYSGPGVFPGKLPAGGSGGHYGGCHVLLDCARERLRLEWGGCARCVERGNNRRRPRHRGTGRRIFRHDLCAEYQRVCHYRRRIWGGILGDFPGRVSAGGVDCTCLDLAEERTGVTDWVTPVCTIFQCLPFNRGLPHQCAHWFAMTPQIGHAACAY